MSNGTEPAETKILTAPLFERVIGHVDQNNVSIEDTISNLYQFFNRYEGPVPTSQKEVPVDAADDEGLSNKLVRLLERQTLQLNELHTLIRRLEDIA